MSALQRMMIERTSKSLETLRASVAEQIRCSLAQHATSAMLALSRGKPLKYLQFLPWRGVGAGFFATGLEPPQHSLLSQGPWSPQPRAR